MVVKGDQGRGGRPIVAHADGRLAKRWPGRLALPRLAQRYSAGGACAAQPALPSTLPQPQHVMPRAGTHKGPVVLHRGSRGRGVHLPTPSAPFTPFHRDVSPTRCPEEGDEKSLPPTPGHCFHSCFSAFAYHLFPLPSSSLCFCCNTTTAAAPLYASSCHRPLRRMVFHPRGAVTSIR